MKLPAAMVLSALLLPAVFQQAPATRPNLEDSGSIPSIYETNPKHIWNRLYDALLIRRDLSGAVYGADRLDPLL